MPPPPHILSRLRSLPLIAVITVLIWLLAESESLRVEKVQARILFHADPEFGRVVRIVPGHDFTGIVSIRLEGSTSKVDSVASLLRNQEIRLEPGSEGVPVEPSPRATVQLLTALSALPAVRNSGVVIAEVDPPTAIISIDTLITRDVTVRAELPPGLALEGAPELDHTSVQLRAPASLELPPDIQLIARLDAAALAALPEGRRTTIANIPIELPEPFRATAAASAGGLRITPAQVSIALTLRSRTSILTLPSIPVHIRLAPTEIGLWDIQLPPESRLLSDVPVSGPADLIDQIRAEKLRPIATISLTFEDLERAATSGAPIEKEVSFSDLPSTLKFEPKQRMVRVTVKRRDAAAPASKPGA